MTRLAERGAALLGGVVRSARVLHGGDLSSVHHVVLQDGRQAVIKGGARVRAEAAMLRAIAAAGAPVPEVLGVDDSTLAIAFVEANGCLDDAWTNLGEVLARLHQTTATPYGWVEDYGFGVLGIPNRFTSGWVQFYAERRLLVHVPYVSLQLAKRIEALSADLGNRLPDRPPSVLLHGDLWGGNVLVTGNRVAGLIDPACAFGHAEIDIAMLTMFDRPAGDFYAAYGKLEPGFEDRLAIYRLWPALVHLRLFGDSYRGMVEGLLVKAGVR